MTESHKTEWDKLFIGGKWVAPPTDEVIDVHSPATGEYVGRVPLAADLVDVWNARSARSGVSTSRRMATESLKGQE